MLTDGVQRGGQEFQVSLSESLLFARLSGDSNPLHVDPVAARRLLFGSTVVHGIDILLRLIEFAFRQNGGGALAGLTASFCSPLLTGSQATIELTEEPALDRCHESVAYRAVSQGRAIQRVSLTMASGKSLWPEPPPTGPIASAAPYEHDFTTLASARGKVTLGFDPEISRRLYPQAARSLPPIQLAVLLATTRIVGMKCPGLHSVYTDLSLTFEVPRPNDTTELRFQVTKADPRFKLLNMKIEGGGASGHINALVRPAPAVQPSFIQVCQCVPKLAKCGCRAIIIGGSRGLGEITAKILAAAGADVIITFAVGSEDARRVANEICDGGGQCHALHFDVTSPVAERPSDLPAGWVPSEVYFFASPHIDIRRAAAWNAALFHRFCDFYVTGLARSLAVIDAVFGSAHPLKLFYPSTEFLNEPIRGGGEYIAAKAAGEQLCRYLSVSRKGLTVESPRLPRVSTDQTTGLKASQMQASLGVMLNLLLAKDR
jgi:NADP-dependent 3-hydroxy acid dehydrogenase YdfG